MSVTGVLLAFERQITARADAPSRQVLAQPATQRLPLEQLIANAAAAEGSAPATVIVRQGENSTVEMSFGRGRAAFLDPYTGNKVGAGGERTRGFFAAVQRWHRALGAALQPNILGRKITGASNLLFFFMCVSGTLLWWPKDWARSRLKNIIVFRRGINGKARDWNWHHVFGFWMVIPLLFITASGVVISYPWASNLLYRMTGNEPPAQAQRAPAAPPTATPNGKPLDELIAIAATSDSEWQTISFRPGSDPLTFTVDRGNGGRPALRSQVMIDARRGSVIRTTTFASNNMGQKLRSWARFTHTGEQFGIVGQAIAALASLSAAFLVFTGLSLALRRFKQFRARAAERVPA
jgi:uncharacterized iron-regulated membrane protein